MNNRRNSTYLTSLYEGTFSVGLDKKFNRIDRDDPPAKRALKLSLNPFLIKTPERNYLFDAGIGDFGENTSTGTIKQNLENHGLTEYDVTDIFTSHLHYDHIGGLAGRSSGYWELTFPDANIWVSKNEWQKVMNQDVYYDEEKTEFISFLQAKANIQFLSSKDQPYPDIKVQEVGGHTEFSQVLYFKGDDTKCLMAGDVLANRGEVNRTFAAKYDFESKKSMKMRKKLCQEAYSQGYTIMGYHDNYHPLFRLTDFREDKGYTINKLTDNVSA